MAVAAVAAGAGRTMPQGLNANGRVAVAIAFARAQIGKPYRWASTGPDSYDCSGLVYRAFQAAGYQFQGRPTTYTLIGMGTAVDKADIQPGDLVFPDAGHVQIYSGGGMIIEAPHTGANVREVPEWGPYWRIRRLIQNNLSDKGTVSGTDGSAPVNGSQSDSTLAALNILAANASNPNTWKRVLFVLLGVIMVLVGVGRMAEGDVTTVVKAVS